MITDPSYIYGDDIEYPYGDVYSDDAAACDAMLDRQSQDALIDSIAEVES